MFWLLVGCSADNTKVQQSAQLKENTERKSIPAIQDEDQVKAIKIFKLLTQTEQKNPKQS